MPSQRQAFVPQPVVDRSPMLTIAAGFRDTCGLRLADGTLSCWGTTAFGVTERDVLEASGTAWSAIANGGYVT